MKAEDVATLQNRLFIEIESMWKKNSINSVCSCSKVCISFAQRAQPVNMLITPYYRFSHLKIFLNFFSFFAQTDLFQVAVSNQFHFAEYSVLGTFRRPWFVVKITTSRSDNYKHKKSENLKIINKMKVTKDNPCTPENKHYLFKNKIYKFWTKWKWKMPEKV